MGHRGLAWALCAVSLTIAALPLSVDAQSPGILTGRVTVEGTRNPVAGATITLQRIDSRRKLTLVTDDHGRFSHVGVRPGVYTVVVECTGYAPVEILGVDIRTDDKVRLLVESTLAAEAPFTRRILRYRRPLLNFEDATISTRVI